MEFIDIKDTGKTIEQIRSEYTELMKTSSNQARKVACQYDLKWLCKQELGMVDWDLIHDEIQLFLDQIVVSEKSRKKSGRQFKLLMIPRGHLKSSVVTKGWVIQQILRNPNVRILLGNAVWLQAKKFLSSIQFYLDNKTKLSDYFGKFKPNTRNNAIWNKDSLLINQRTLVQDAPTLSTCGVESEQVGQHYDIIILDDVVARENISTPEQRDKVKAFFRDCLNLLEPTGVMIVIGTTWHEDDLYGELESVELHPEFETFKRVAEQGTEESVIFKKKFNLALLHQIRGTSPESIRAYSAQYLLNPYPTEDMEFKNNWIRYWRELPKEPLFVSITIDPSLGKDNSDWAAITAVGRSNDKKTYVLDARHFRRKVEDIPIEVCNTVKKINSLGYQVGVIGLEAFGFQQTLQKPIQKMLKDNGLFDYVELLPVNVKQGKNERIRALIPKFNNYEVFLHDSQQDLIKEILRWNPNIKGRSDDIIDSLAWQIHYWERKAGEKYVAKNQEWTLDWMIKNHKYGNRFDDEFILKEFR